MPALTRKDLDVLDHYATRGNRELYWNYLAQREGNDGYGLLALGVVRNDNAPGATANAYAAMMAREVNGRELSERDWEMFGRELMHHDLAVRREHFDNGRALPALNLSAREVQRVHDRAFREAGITPDAWTPRQLLETARRNGGEREVERVWTLMLDNQAYGLRRLGGTLRDIVTLDDARVESGAYTLRMTAARALATQALGNTDPDLIGTEALHYQRMRDGWLRVSPTPQGDLTDIVRDPALIRSLDDTRELRLERQRMREDFHPDDPAHMRGIERSPWLLSESRPGDEPAPVQTAALRGTAPPVLSPAAQAFVNDADIRLREACDRGGPGLDDAQARHLAVQLAARAMGNPLVRRIDDVQFSLATPDAPAGSRVFAVHRPFGALEPTFHVDLPLQHALQQPAQARDHALQAAEVQLAARQPTPAEAEPQRDARRVVSI